MTDYPQADDPTIRRLWMIMQRHRGHENRISREALTFAMFTKVSKSYDRKVRDAIAELPIIWDDGYFIPRTFQEANKYQASMISRITSISKRLRILDTWLKENQQELRYEQEALWHG